MTPANDNDDPIDPLDMTLRALLKRLLTGHARSVETDWINIRGADWPWRHIVAAAERGEISISRVGRKLLVKRAELDRWLALQAITPRSRKPPVAPPVDASPVAHLLADAGFKRR